MRSHAEGPPKEFNEGPKGNPEKVKAIVDWLESRGSWGSGKSLAEYAEGAPDVSEGDLQAMLLEMKPYSTGNAPYDLRGYYITALAHRISEKTFSQWYEQHPNASDEEVNQWWNTEAKIELTHPETGRYSSDRFRQFGHYWEKGTLILRGNYGENTASSMRGGKVIVEGNTGPRAGSLMSGGELQINGITGYELGYGMTGGHIYARVSAPAPGSLMHGGTIEIDEINLSLPGSNNVKTDKPWVGSGKKGGRVIVGGKEF